LLLTEKDVAGLLQCSVRLLQQWRAEQVQPPLWITLGPKLIRYPAQALIEWVDTLAHAPSPGRAAALASVLPVAPALRSVEMDGLDEPLFRGGRRRSRHATLESFLSTGLPQDEWLFRQRENERRRDFLATLDDQRLDDNEVMWLRLDVFFGRLALGRSDLRCPAVSRWPRE
jgi:hypothetical protein